MELIRLKVAAASNPKSVAGSIVNNIREKKDVEIVVMGAAAVNQAMKAITIARDYIGPEGVEILIRPEFTHLELDGEQKSAMRFKTPGRPRVLQRPLRQTLRVPAVRSRKCCQFTFKAPPRPWLRTPRGVGLNRIGFVEERTG